MADSYNNNAENASGNNTSNLENLNTDESYVNDRMIAVTNLVMVARLQTKEAEIRSRYAREFANRAVTEAMAAHQVSASLARTSRMVAALALEFSNETSLLNESFVDSDNDSRYSSFLSPDVSFQSAGDIGAFSNESRPSDAPNNESTGQLDSGSNLNKYDAQFPEDVGVNHGVASAEKHLPTLYEDSLNKRKRDSGDFKSENKSSQDEDATNHLNLSDELKNLDIRRKMMLYRDSKLLVLPCNLVKAAIPDQVIQRTYIEQATQTNIAI